jgi:putative ABC transport system substrate-binding protein
VQIAAKSILERIDVLFLMQDNAVISALDAILPIATKAKIPVFAPDDQAVAKGALAALGANYYDMGRVTGSLVVQILKGTAPGTIAWRQAVRTDLFLNVAAAKALNLSLPESALKRAKKTFGE